MRLTECWEKMGSCQRDDALYMTFWWRLQRDISNQDLLVYLPNHKQIDFEFYFSNLLNTALTCQSRNIIIIVVGRIHTLRTVNLFPHGPEDLRFVDWRLIDINPRMCWRTKNKLNLMHFWQHEWFRQGLRDKLMVSSHRYHSIVFFI